MVEWPRWLLTGLAWSALAMGLIDTFVLLATIGIELLSGRGWTDAISNLVLAFLFFNLRSAKDRIEGAPDA